MTSLKMLFRFFFRELGTSLLAVFVLAVGLTLSITMFSMVNGIVWSSPDVEADGEIYQMVWHREEHQRAPNYINVRDIRYFEEKQTSFSHLAYFQGSQMGFYSPELDRPAEKYRGSIVSLNFMDMVNVKPMKGRAFTAEDAASEETPVVIISHKLWQDFFGGSDDVVGQYVEMNGWSHEVIGVMAPGVQFPNDNDYWKVSDWTHTDSRPRVRAARMPMVGILKSGVSKEQARTEFASLAAVLKEQYPDTNKLNTAIRIRTLSEAWTGENTAKLMYLLLAGSFLVLLSAAANVSNLILARSSKRQHELAVRKSLGASPRQLITQILMDTSFLAGIGLILSLVFSNFVCTYLWNIYETNWFFKPYWWHINIDAKGYLFAFFLAFIAMLVSGLVVALRVVGAKGTLNILKDDSRTSSGLFIGKLAKILVGVQITLSTILLIVGISMISYTNFKTDRGIDYDPYQILTTWIQAFKRLGLDSGQQVYDFYADITENIEAIPGINDVSFSFAYGGYFVGANNIEIEGKEAERDEEKLRSSVNIVAADFFEFFDVKPVIGRVFEPTDIDGSQLVVVIDQSFARRHYGKENPLGKRVKMDSIGNPGEAQRNNKKTTWTEWATIIGVVPDMRGNLPGWHEDRKTQIFVSHKQILSRGMSLLVKGDGDMRRYIPSIRRALSEDMPEFAPMWDIETLGRDFERENAYTTVITKIIVSFGVAALIMAAAGLYGLIAFTTQLKEKEIGIRKALGAPDVHILKLMLAYARWQCLIGIVIGASASIAICRQLFDSLEQNIEFFSISAFPIGIALIAIITMLAILIPSYRAAQKPPSETLLAR